MRTTDDFALATPTHGLVPSDSWAADALVPYIGTPKRLSFANSSGGTFALLGYFSPLGSTYTVSGSVTFEAVDADTSRWAAIGLATDDKTFNGSATISGYNCIIRESGQFHVFRQVPGATTNGVMASGSSTQVGSTGTTSAISAGQTVTWSLAVTSTQIVFTVAGTAITAVDSTYRPLPYVHIGKTSGSSLAVSFSSITIT
jgi:hypothetical protein